MLPSLCFSSFGIQQANRVFVDVLPADSKQLLYPLPPEVDQGLCDGLFSLWKAVQEVE
ncbi:hypothetical protein D3C84_1166930 [compost metagenome]